jgi:hypothetical protein
MATFLVKRGSIRLKPVILMGSLSIDLFEYRITLDQTEREIAELAQMSFRDIGAITNK